MNRELEKGDILVARKNFTMENGKPFLFKGKFYKIKKTQKELYETVIFIDSEYQKNHDMYASVIHHYFLTDKELRAIKLKHIEKKI